MSDRVFVYGSLLPGLINNHYLKGATLVSENVLLGGFQMYDVSYFPTCFHTGNMLDTVIGEVYKISQETFKRIDVLEGYPRFYNRIQIADMNIPTWIYVWDKIPDNMEQVWSGNWREHFELKKMRTQ